MNCAERYDLVHTGYPYLWVPIVGVASVIALISSYQLYTRYVSPEHQRRSLPLPGLIVAVAISSFLLIIRPFTGFTEYRHLVDAIRANGMILVIGRVQNFRPFTTHTESFSVCGRTFSIKPGSVDPGFHLTEAEGSPIKVGETVRIGYVGNRIVRVDVCARVEQDCIASPR